VSTSQGGTYVAALEAAARQEAAGRPAVPYAAPGYSPTHLVEPFGPPHDQPERVVELQITDAPGPHPEARAVLCDEKGGVAEQFRHFALRVAREIANLSNRAIVITSALRAEGKTTTSCNLSLALSSIAGDKPTALIDFDLRRPALGRYLGTHHTVGIEAVLSRKADLEQARVTTNFPFLDLYPVVRPTPQPHELLASDVLPETIEKLRSRYHTVIIDTPPVLLVPDVELVLPHVGGFIVVVRSRKTRVDSMKQLLDLLPRERMLGTFLNETKKKRHNKQYGYYYRNELDQEPPE